MQRLSGYLAWPRAGRKAIPRPLLEPEEAGWEEAPWVTRAHLVAENGVRVWCGWGAGAPDTVLVGTWCYDPSPPPRNPALEVSELTVWGVLCVAAGTPGWGSSRVEVRSGGADLEEGLLPQS